MRKFVNIAFISSLLLSIYLWQTNVVFAIILFTISLVVYLLFNLYGSLYLSSNYFVKAYTLPIKSKEKTAVLTFDDGPIEQTKEILAVLEKHNCKASFFVIGKKAQEHLGLLKQVDKAGHIIGDSTYYARGRGLYIILRYEAVVQLGVLDVYGSQCTC